ncbi:ABC transporter permease [Rubritalea tangerina]|uniref:ABC transporter permease n=1 Tax=Rubritalea tangerina TaxID=430798 RepID=A0ABW4Z9M3_9BACT
MIQTVTLLMDSLRMVLARKLFWVSVIISALIGVIYLSISLVPEGVSFLFGAYIFENTLFTSETQEGEWFYIIIFTNFINRYWLGSGALLLALITTVSVFPEFTKNGAIEVSLSKPVSRVKLFIVKYIGCLLFVVLQTGLFALLAFIAVYLRLGYLNWSLFWVVGVITFAFSLIHCVQVLVGVITRSSLVALLCGVLFWAMVWLVQVTEQTMYLNTYAVVEEKMDIDWKTGTMSGYDEDRAVDDQAAGYYDLIRKASLPLPKVRDVTLSADRLVVFRDSGSVLEQIDLLESIEKNDIQKKSQRAERRARERNSTSYIMLSSLAFEFVVLMIGCWIFVRKDY